MGTVDKVEVLRDASVLLIALGSGMLISVAADNWWFVAISLFVVLCFYAYMYKVVL